MEAMNEVVQVLQMIKWDSLLTIGFEAKYILFCDWRKIFVVAAH